MERAVFISFPVVLTLVRATPFLEQHVSHRIPPDGVVAKSLSETNTITKIPAQLQMALDDTIAKMQPRRVVLEILRTISCSAVKAWNNREGLTQTMNISGCCSVKRLKDK